ncbi:hypothetical protein L208DRAFT_1258781, partial [Tricholoma matsutake]
KAFTKRTIKSAFRTTGIHPFNPDIIKDDAFAPALNTTTHAAQPVPAALPSILREATVSATPSFADLSGASLKQGPSSASLAASSSAPDREATGSSDSPSIPSYELVAFPGPLPPRASHKAVAEHADALEKFALSAKKQMEADYAVKKLMDNENERLQQQLFAKKNKPAKK